MLFLADKNTLKKSRNAEDNDVITNDTPYKRTFFTKEPIKKSKVGSTFAAKVPCGDVLFSYNGKRGV